MPFAGTFGNIGRGTFTGPGLTNFDVPLFKIFSVDQKRSLQFRAEAFNVFNHTNFRGLSTSRAITNETLFGSVVSFRDPRVLQFGIKLGF